MLEQLLNLVKEHAGDVNDFFEERRLASFSDVDLRPQTTVNSPAKREEIKPT